MNFGFLLNLWASAAIAVAGLLLLGRLGGRFKRLNIPFVKAVLILWTLRQIVFIVIYFLLNISHPASLASPTESVLPRLILALVDIGSVLSLGVSLTLYKGKAYEKLGLTFLEIGAFYVFLLLWATVMFFLPVASWILPSELIAGVSFFLAMPAFIHRYGRASAGVLLTRFLDLLLQASAYEALFIRHEPNPLIDLGALKFAVFFGLACTKTVHAGLLYYLISSQDPDDRDIKLTWQEAALYILLTLGFAATVSQLREFVWRFSTSPILAVISFVVTGIGVILTLIFRHRNDKSKAVGSGHLEP